jgi:hypothetical protein
MKVSDLIEIEAVTEIAAKNAYLRQIAAVNMGILPKDAEAVWDSLNEQDRASVIDGVRAVVIEAAPIIGEIAFSLGAEAGVDYAANPESGVVNPFETATPA